MANKVIADLNLNDRVILKDQTYGRGDLLGINKKTNEYMIGYKSGDPRFSGSWTNAGGKFPESGVYSEKVKDYSHFIFVPATSELHSNESNSEGLTVGDTVEIYCDTNGALASDVAKQDAKQTRKGQIVGFYENGAPMIYVEKSDLKEIGSVYNTNMSRNIHEMFEGKLDAGRNAYLNGTNGVNNGWIKQVKKGKKVKTMSNKTSGNTGDRPAFLEMMKEDMKDAGYRVASTQMINGTRAAILKVMETKGQGSDRVQAMSDLLNTEFGKSVISMILGISLNYMPGLSNDERVAKLAEEFRVSGFAIAGNAAMDVVMQHFLPVISNALSTLPAEEVRVSEKVETKEEKEEEEEKVETKGKELTA